jgi:precorrin-6B methylase 1
MASKQLKTKIVSALMKNHGYGKENAENLIEKHIDIVEVNEDDLTPEEIASQLEEEEMQHGDED